MKTRKMYASPGWGDAVTTGFGVRSTPNAFQVVPVLVTDATDMPDFEPGDRVRVRHSGKELDVAGLPIEIDGYWYVPARTIPDRGLILSTCECLTKLRHEKTVTLRVTGDGDAIDRVAGYICDVHNDKHVRVERVEEDR